MHFSYTCCTLFFIFSYWTIGGEEQVIKAGPKNPHIMLGTYMQQLTRARQAKPRWVSSQGVRGRPGTGLKWTKQKYQVWPKNTKSQYQVRARAEQQVSQTGHLSVTGNQGPRIRPYALEGRDKRSGCSESCGHEGQLPPDPALTLGRVNAWIRMFGWFEGWGTENGHAGRGELQ